MQTLEKILVTVRTYPTPSTQYRETVCTGGITENGEWRRLYPVPFLFLDEKQRFRTWDVIETTVRPAVSDNRLESRRPHLPTLRIVEHLDGWEARCQWVNDTIYQSIQSILAAGRSIGPVAVREILDVTAKKGQSEWDPGRKAKLEQLFLFDKQHPLEKIPYDFRFIWRDYDGHEHKSLVLSWEMAQTWRNYRQNYNNPIARIREKLLGDTFGPKKQPAFFMGNHSRRRHVFMVCGWFIPPQEESESAHLWSNNNTP